MVNMSVKEWTAYLRTFPWECSQCGGTHKGLHEEVKGRLSGFCPDEHKTVLAYIWTSDGWHDCSSGDIIFEED
jgi:hypothetical protein